VSLGVLDNQVDFSGGIYNMDPVGLSDSLPDNVLFGGQLGDESNNLVCGGDEDDGCVMSFISSYGEWRVYLDDQVYYHPGFEPEDVSTGGSLSGYEGDEEDNVLELDREEVDYMDRRSETSLPENGSTDTDVLSCNLPIEVGGAISGLWVNSSGDIQGGGTCLSGLLPMDLVRSRDARQDNLQLESLMAEWMANSRAHTERASTSIESDQ